MLWAQERPYLLTAGKRIARGWKPAALVFAISFGLIAVATMVLPNKYQTRLKILVKNERVDPLLSVDKQTQGILYLDDISESRINTEIELLTSKDILREVVSRCHLAEASGGSYQSREKREETALRRLQKDLVVTPVRKSNVIEATYESTDPARSAEVLRTVSDLYLSAHLKLHGAPGSYTFFHQLAASYAQKLEQAEADLASFRQSHQIVALPEEKTLALQKVADLEKQLAESSAATQKSGLQASQLRKSVASTPATIEKERRSVPNQSSMEQLNTVLIGLENKRAQAVLRYQPTDRNVRELDTQIQQTQAALNEARRSNAEEVSTGANPTLGNAQSELIRAQADFAGNQAETAQIAQQLRASRARLLTLDEQTVPYEDMIRRVKQLEDLSESYKKTADEARVTEMLDTQRISNVAISEQPYQSALPTSPKRGLILSLGFIWSLLFGAATALGIDFFSERVTSTFELEQVTGLPLLAAVPSGALTPGHGGYLPALYVAMQRSNPTVSRSQS